MTTNTLLGKADRALAAARHALEQGDTETAADRAYYAVFYAAWGLLEAEGLPRPKTHNGLIAEFSRLFVKSHRIEPSAGAVLARLHNLRLVADYTLASIPETDAQRAVTEADTFIRTVKALIFP